MAKKQIREQEQVPEEEQAQPVLSRSQQIHDRLQEIDTEIEKLVEGEAAATEELGKFQKNYDEERDRRRADVDKILEQFHLEGSNKELMHRILVHKDATQPMRHLERSIQKMQDTIKWHKEKKAALNRERGKLKAEQRMIRGNEVAVGVIDGLQKYIDNDNMMQAIFTSVTTNLRALEDIVAENQSGLSVTQWLSRVGASEFIINLVDIGMDKQRLRTTDHYEFRHRASQMEMGGKNPLFRNFMRSKDFGVKSVYTDGDRKETQFGFRTIT